MKVAGFVLGLLAFFCFLKHDAPFILLGSVVAPLGFFLYFEGLKQEIVAEVDRMQRKRELEAQRAAWERDHH